VSLFFAPAPRPGNGKAVSNGQFRLHRVASRKDPAASPARRAGEKKATPMQKPVPTKEHEWLLQLEGEWISTFDAGPSPDAAPQELVGKETGRSLDGLWLTLEGECEMPGFGMTRTVMTLGFDTAKNRFVGSWHGTMMTMMWSYDGFLGEDGKTLILESEGPDFADPGKTALYRDIVTMVDADHRTLTGNLRQADGTWKPFCTTRYARKK
jgi:hypothetical protein